MKETVILNKKEQSRLVILNQVEVGTVTARRAAELLGLSPAPCEKNFSGVQEGGHPNISSWQSGRKALQCPEGGQGDRWWNWHSQLTRVVILSTLVNF